MRVYLLRHGIALDRQDPRCQGDFERPLTGKGVRRTERAAAGLVALGVAPALVMSSPYLRARQTAVIAARVLGLDVSAIRESQHLVPEVDPEGILQELGSASAESALCVGHAPNLDLLLGRAVGLGCRTITGIKKAGVACVEIDSRIGGRLVWLMEPKSLRALAGGASGQALRR